VQTFEASVGLDAKFMQALGVQLSSKFTDQVSITLTDKTTNEEEETFSLDQKIRFDTPANYERIDQMSDDRRIGRVTIPGKVILDADVYFVEYVRATGSLWRARFNRLLSVNGSVADRTFDTAVTVEVGGSNRQLTREVYERPLTPADCHGSTNVSVQLDDGIDDSERQDFKLVEKHILP
jgi:hypothetical protein